MNSKRYLPWAELYRPQFRRDLVGNSNAIENLRKWILSWKTSTPKQKAVLLVGPPGVGKTASVGALANDLGVELVEFNASDKRNKSVIEDQVWKATTQHTLDGRMRIVLLDEVDGLSGTSDRGGSNAILRVIKEAVHPVVMTANDLNSPRLKGLKKSCLIIEFEHVEYEDMIGVLKGIAEQQDTAVSKELLIKIVENSNGDLRAAISDLEKLVKGGKTGESLTSISRDLQKDMVESLRRLFMATDSDVARRIVSDADVNYEDLLLWLEENLHQHLGDHSELDSGFNQLSLADLTLGRIMIRQEWKLLAYLYDFLSSGIVLSRQFTPYRTVEYSRTTWPLLVWRGNRERDGKGELLESIAKVANVSQSRISKTHQETIEQVLRWQPKRVSDFAAWLDVKRKTLRVGRSSRQ